MLQNVTSAFGAFLDPVADKLMVATVLVLLSTRPIPAGFAQGNAWLVPCLTCGTCTAGQRSRQGPVGRLPDLCTGCPACNVLNLLCTPQPCQLVRSPQHWKQRMLWTPFHAPSPLLWLNLSLALPAKAATCRTPIPTAFYLPHRFFFCPARPPICPAAIIGREITMSALREWAAALGPEAHQAVAVSWLGKWKTAAQMISITLLLAAGAAGAGEWVPAAGSAGVVLLGVAAGLTVWSLCEYFAGLWRFMV